MVSITRPSLVTVTAPRAVLVAADPHALVSAANMTAKIPTFRMDESPSGLRDACRRERISARKIRDTSTRRARTSSRCTTGFRTRPARTKACMCLSARDFSAARRVAGAAERARFAVLVTFPAHDCVPVHSVVQLVVAVHVTFPLHDPPAHDTSHERPSTRCHPRTIPVRIRRCKIARCT